MKRARAAPLRSRILFRCVYAFNSFIPTLQVFLPHIGLSDTAMSDPVLDRNLSSSDPSVNEEKTSSKSKFCSFLRFLFNISPAKGNN